LRLQRRNVRRQRQLPRPHLPRQGRLQVVTQLAGRIPIHVR
jgi:hypothetical protein